MKKTSLHMMTKSSDDLSPHISEDTKQEIKNQIMAIADDDMRASLLSKFHAGQYNLLLRNAVFYQQPTLAGVLLTYPLVNVNNRGTQTGDTALHIATRTGNLTMVKLLVAHSAYLDAVNAKGISSVLLALYEKQFEVAEYLLDQGAKLMLPSEDATPDLDEANYTDSQETLITRVKHKINNGTKEMCQRPSIIDRPIHYVILADAFVAKYCQELDGKQPALQNLLPYKAIVRFFEKNHIPTLTRQALFKVCSQYKDLPYLTVTEIFSDLLTNDQSLYLPIAEADFINISLLLNIFEKLEEHFQGVSLKVAINPMVKLAPKSTMLKWEMRIDHSMASENEVAALSRKMGAAFENKVGASTIYFGKVSESLVASFIRFLDEQPQFTMSQPVFK